MSNFLDGSGWSLIWRSALVVGALAAVAVQLGPLPDGPDGVGSEPVGAPPARPPAAAPAPAATYTGIVEHPLFDPSRQPWRPLPPLPAVVQAPAPVAARPALQTPRGYVLIGTVMSMSRKSALLRSSGGKTVVLSEGQVLDGWTLRVIEHNRVGFEADGARFELAFVQGRNAGSGRFP